MAKGLSAGAGAAGGRCAGETGFAAGMVTAPTAGAESEEIGGMSGLMCATAPVGEAAWGSEDSMAAPRAICGAVGDAAALTAAAMLCVLLETACNPAPVSTTQQ